MMPGLHSHAMWMIYSGVNKNLENSNRQRQDTSNKMTGRRILWKSYNGKLGVEEANTLVTMFEWSSAFSNNSWSIFLKDMDVWTSPFICVCEGCITFLWYKILMSSCLCILKRMSIDIVILLSSFGSQLHFPRPFIPIHGAYLWLLTP